LSNTEHCCTNQEIYLYSFKCRNGKRVFKL